MSPILNLGTPGDKNPRHWKLRGHYSQSKLSRKGTNLLFLLEIERLFLELPTRGLVTVPIKISVLIKIGGGGGVARNSN
jgi:hypothetical protein